MLSPRADDEAARVVADEDHRSGKRVRIGLARPQKNPSGWKLPETQQLAPTVGANCRGGVTADAIGWLKLWARISVRESGEGVCVQGTHMQLKQESSKKPRT